jgi:hypothetical protein
MAEELNQKKVVGRSAAYPGFTLEQAVEATKTLRTKLGNAPYSRDIAAKALGYSGVTGSSSTKIAACVHFGLLVREGNSYKQSDLANQIFNPQSEEERSFAVRTAFRTPNLYVKLLSAFGGKALPTLLENILVRQYEIQERAAGDAATIFKKSAEYAGMFTNGILTSNEEPQKQEAEEPGGKPQITGDPTNASEHAANSRNHVAISTDALRVPIDGTDIMVVFPLEYAYELSTGTFSTGIKELTENVKSLKPDGNQSSGPTEE